MVTPVDPPTLSLDVDDLVDWLELTALFSEFRVARLDALLGALLQLENEPEDDIGERDQQRDQMIEKIENEVELRKNALGETYPFDLTESGEELIIENGWKHPQFCFYLICLVTTHVTGSEILGKPPVGQLLTRLRNRVFQIVATLGLAGLSSGPAFSVGWPRERGESIVSLLNRAAAVGGGFGVRNPPSAYIPPQEKDGGIDVIAWTASPTPPPPAFYFGQTASGKNWPEKPVNNHARVFVTAYMQDHMTGNINHLTIIPYRVMDEAFWNSQHLLHMGILDRLQLPARAWLGVGLSLNGVPVDGADRLDSLAEWLAEFIDYAQAA